MTLPNADQTTRPGRIYELADLRLRPPSWWLQLTGIAHLFVGAVAYRRALGEIAAARLVRAVPDRSDRATAFWFMAAAPILWVAGRLLRSAEGADDLAAQRAAGLALTTTGMTGAAAMPTSGFWAVAAIGLSTLRRGLK